LSNSTANSLHLAASVRNRGIGAHLIEVLQARGARLRKPATFDVMHGNRAKGLHLRLGFKPVRANLDKTPGVAGPAGTARDGVGTTSSPI
jgi:ribosomal protein S18 acetylase RimI-like enzyme